MPGLKAKNTCRRDIPYSHQAEDLLLGMLRIAFSIIPDNPSEEDKKNSFIVEIIEITACH